MPDRQKHAPSVALLEPDIEQPAARGSAPGDDPARRVEIVSVSAADEDHDALERCLDRAWTLQRAYRLEDGLGLLCNRSNTTPAVICDQDLQPDAWKVLLRGMAWLSNPPLLIISSGRPDAQLWAEAVNLGAYDVLAKPFDESEVRRTVLSACARWKDRSAYRNPAAIRPGSGVADSAA